MKRFIAYLYEYKDGRRIKNTGFMRVDIREKRIEMEVCIRNYSRTMEKGTWYVLINQENIIGIEAGTLHIQKGQCNNRIRLEKNNILESSYNWEDVIGVAIDFKEEGCLLSSWNDEWEEQIANNSFVVFDNKEADKKTEELALHTNQIEQEVKEDTVKHKAVYEKIEPSRIRSLPSSNWHLNTNSFLIHGVCNYGFLFLKTELDGEENHWLGVPGYFEKQEMLMAALFGFAEFEPIEKEVVDMEIGKESKLILKENQETKTGVFGAWFVMLDK